MGWWKDYIQPNEYNYYDSPEGEDCFHKLWFCTKYGGLYGIFISTIDNLLYSHPPTYGAALVRCGAITGMTVGMGAAFAATTCMATNIRKKDDYINYALGGASSGMVFGAVTRRLKFGILGSIGLAALACLKKDSVVRGWTFFELPPNSKQITGTIYTPKMDYTLLKDPGKTWRSE